MSKRIEPDEAARLIEDGWIYLDVRSVSEFEQGHPKGAWNVPLLHLEPGRGMTPNPDFLADVKRAFAVDSQLVVGCKSSGRSAKAAALLEQDGFTQIVDMAGGFSGQPAPGGGVACQGWEARGLPTAACAESGRSYAALKAGN
ncbi:MAG: rhodanese-related sulfurtransferase [Hyphomicrobiaceae bacterium]|jgi:rhodanese-related sulfurtransferase